MKMILNAFSAKKGLSLFMILLALAVSSTTVACGKRGEAEKAGEKIDETIEDSKDAVEDAVDGDGPLEDAGEKVDEKVD